MKSGTTFLLGVLVGIGAGEMIRRIRIVGEEDHPERVLDRINDSLGELERRAENLESHHRSKS